MKLAEARRILDAEDARRINCAAVVLRQFIETTYGVECSDGKIPPSPGPIQEGYMIPQPVFDDVMAILEGEQ